jgi:hypothetical protein
MSIQISTQEIVQNGKTIIYYKSSLGGPRKCLLPVNSFERATEIEKTIRKAMSWKLFQFQIKRTVESWDRIYYSITLNGDFLETKPCAEDAEEEIRELTKKLCVKYSTIAVI